MSEFQGTEATRSHAAVDPLLAAVRRLTLLADEASDMEAIFRELARELLNVPGADEVHVYHLADDASQELVAVYLFEGEGRLSYLLPRGERPPGVTWVVGTGRSLLAVEDHELTASVPRLKATGPATAALLLPLNERGEVAAVVMLVRRRGEAFDEVAVELARTLVDQASTALALVAARVEAGTDPVAGCLNHRAMRRRLDEEIDRATRAGSPLSCLLLDLDNFKLVNDRHGHQAGDVLLRAVVQALVGEFRAFDRVARYGGDEFVVVLPNAGLASAAAAANRALERLQAVPAYEGGPGISASIGVAQWQPTMGTDELLEACDAALRRSKREGKGRVTAAPETFV
jgi:diguanylate cyclase (GGDEF)-like protein